MSPFNLPSSHVLASTPQGLHSQLLFTWRGTSSVQKHEPQLLSSKNPTWRRLCHHPIHYTKHTSALTRTYTDQSKQGGSGGRYHAVAGSHPNCTAPLHPSWIKIRDIARKTLHDELRKHKSISPVEHLHQNTPPPSKLASSHYQMQNERNCNITVQLAF